MSTGRKTTGLCLHESTASMNAPLPISVLVATRNEELNIAACLRSLAGLVEEVYVIDSESTDKTRDIAAQMKANVVNLPYDHSRIIPWIFQWGLDNLEITTEWVLILEADQRLTPQLREELLALFAKRSIPENGFFIKKRQIFRGRVLRFGGYGSKYLLKLFRKNCGQLDVREQDTRVYVTGKIGYLKNCLLEDNAKENDILFYLEKHLRYADAFAHEEYDRRVNGFGWKMRPKLLGHSDERVLWLKQKYYHFPLYWRAAGYFAYRYFLRLGILDGKEGFIFHFLQAFWFRLVLDIRLDELLRSKISGTTADEGLDNKGRKCEP